MTFNKKFNDRSYFRQFMSLFMLFFCIFLFSSCENRKTIVNALEEKDANEIIVFLSGKGIDVGKVAEIPSGGGGAKIILYDIDVPNDQVTEAMTILNQAGLPRRRAQSLLGIFSGAGLVPSDLEQKIRYEAGLAEQIASTIRKIDGVIDAEVQVSFPQEDPLNPGQYKGKITASVFVKHNGILDDPNSHLITKIKRLVASSITGLSYDDVTVIPVRAQINESQTGFLGGNTEEEKQYVDVWTIILAKDSVTRFRVIFFLFSAVILILLLILVWISWKMYPLLMRYGGIRELFHVHPIKLEPKLLLDENRETPAKEQTSNEAKHDEEEQNKDIDIT
jgi:type III secretion protein J